MLSLPSLSHLLAVVLNTAVKTNPDINIDDLESRSFAIAIDELPQDIAIAVENGKVVPVNDEDIATVDVIVSGNLKAVLNMIQDQDEGLDADELYISGKINTAKRYQYFLGSLGINWQTLFAQFMDTEKANKLAEAVEQGLHMARGSIEQFGNGLKHYVIQEKQWVVTQSELAALKRGIELLNTKISDLSDKV